ncbi:MAG TPA: GMP/IMP nucleotidase [Steroidobacteraceae bacterium]|nr:GMP/IMP nucleotidase [Steroidobacteraceae bacterium]
MPLHPSQRPPWGLIDTALLDLDGTLLDPAFDNWFWLEHVPHAYAAARGLGADEAHAQLVQRFRAHEGTLPWYCIDHWSRELALDIRAMKHAEAARIRWLPGAQAWLEALRKAGKRLVLLTNAHPETLRIKDERTGVTLLFDAVVSSHRFGAPKEDPRFWRALHDVEPFDRERSVFVDDSVAVLRAARAAGLRWVYGIGRAAEAHDGFPSVTSVAELGP